jgi:hypothetical protein
MDSKLFEAALERAAKTWKTYVAAICILHLTLIIDSLSGFSFLRGETPIDLAGFKVVREALSATYGILFSLFVATAFLQSRLLTTRSSGTDLSTSNGLSVLDLWFLSPFSDSPLLRRAFWFLFIDGFLFLALFSFVHLALIIPPDPTRMSSAIYMAIGAVDLVLLVICVPFGYLTYKNFKHVRSMLSQG